MLASQVKQAHAKFSTQVKNGKCTIRRVNNSLETSSISPCLINIRHLNYNTCSIASICPWWIQPCNCLEGHGQLRRLVMGRATAMHAKQHYQHHALADWRGEELGHVETGWPNRHLCKVIAWRMNGGFPSRCQWFVGISITAWQLVLAQRTAWATWQAMTHPDTPTKPRCVCVGCRQHTV